MKAIFPFGDILQVQGEVNPSYKEGALKALC